MEEEGEEVKDKVGMGSLFEQTWQKNKQNKYKVRISGYHSEVAKLQHFFQFI